MRTGSIRTTGAVVLAAGASSRLGEMKQLVRVGGERLLDRAVRVAQEAGFAPVVVVLGFGAERIVSECRLEGVRVVVNEGWAEGMGSSVRAGVEAMGDAAGIVVMTCDQPAVTAEHLRALVGDGVAGSSYGGKVGVPGYFPTKEFGELLGLRGDVGARGLLRGARLVELRGGEMDVDTVEGLAVVQVFFE